MPGWTDIACRVLEVDFERGRGGALDAFTPGTANVRIVNEDGTATWQPDAGGVLAPGSWLRIRADDQVLWTARCAWWSTATTRAPC